MNHRRYRRNSPEAAFWVFQSSKAVYCRTHKSSSLSFFAPNASRLATWRKKMVSHGFCFRACGSPKHWQSMCSTRSIRRKKNTPTGRIPLPSDPTRRLARLSKEMLLLTRMSQDPVLKDHNTLHLDTSRVHALLPRPEET